MNPEKHFRKFSLYGSFAAKYEIESRSNRHLTQSRLHVSGCIAERYGLLHIVVQGPPSFFSVRHTVVELRGVKLAKFLDFGLFSPYKTRKNYLPVTSLQPRDYIAQWFRFFHVIIEGIEWVPSGTGGFFRLLIGELWTPKLAQIFAYGKWLYPYRMLLNGMTALDKNVWKRATLRTDVLSHELASPLPLKSPPKPHFGGPFNAKSITRRTIRKFHVNAATKLKLYTYIGISKYLGCVKIFPLGGVQGAQGP